MTDWPDHLLIHGDARKIPLADGSVHCCACSPPFFGLRDYGTGRWEGGDPACDHIRGLARKDGNRRATWGEFKDGDQVERHEGGKIQYRDRCGKCGARRVDRQLGLEPTVEAFVAAIVTVGREVWRVLHPTGSWWLDIGDSMSSKNLCLIPERVALALQADGWVVRAKPPWIKPSPMPESACDRPNVAHESIFLLAKGSRYYFDMEAVRVPNKPSSVERVEYGNRVHPRGWHTASVPISGGVSDLEGLNPAGRHLRTNDFFTASLDAAIDHHEAQLAHLRRIRKKGGLLLSEAGDPLALWVGTEGFNGAHFATWPRRLVEWMVKASSSERGCCATCGAPWVRDIRPTPEYSENLAKARDGHDWYQRVGDGSGNPKCRGKGSNRQGGIVSSYQTIGWRPSCRCDSPLPPQPCTVLDPFCGSGTTILTALALGRRAVGIDLSREYLGMARDRIAAGLRPVSRYDPERPKKPLSGQLSLFDSIEETEVTA